MQTDQNSSRAPIARLATNSVIVSALNELGFDVWFKHVAAKAYSEDPWLSFSSAYTAHPKLSSKLKGIVDLFIRKRAVDQNVINRLLGRPAVRLLKRGGVIELGPNNKVISRYCLLHSFDTYLFMEWPVQTKSGSLISRETYLSNSSYDAGREIQKRRSVNTGLDLGCGCGITTMLLARMSKKTMAIDVDSAAVNLTTLNLAVNGCEANVFHCDWNNLGMSGLQFDFINANPPWRIVPPSVNYPNPVARAGKGRDGLDYVRQVFGVISKFLTSEGEAVVRFDLPQGIPEAEELLTHPERSLGTGFTIRPKILGFVSNEDQAKLSSSMCAHLNPSVANLSEVFLRHYRGLNIKGLVNLMCVIEKHNS